MPETKTRRFLREKEAKQLMDEFSKKLKIPLTTIFNNEKFTVEIAETQIGKVIYINSKPLIAQIQDTLLPTLHFQKVLQLLPKITVNMGAVPHICNGADVLAPGIVKIEGNWTRNDYILIVDERHQKPLAITQALTDSQTAQKLKHGKTAKNLHYVGDPLWNQLKTM